MTRSKTKKQQRPDAPVAPPAPERSRTSLTWICALAVFAGTWLVFESALDGQWLRWDDDQLLVNVQEWRGLGPKQLGWMFTTFHMGPYQPLSWLSYAVDHALFGLDARAFHRTNVLLHAATATACFFLARSLFAIATRSRSAIRIELGAALAAGLWAVHPLRVESVAWITERRDSLSGLFLVLSACAWLAYARATTHPRRRYVLALLAFAASLLSKGLALAFPIVLLVLDVWPLRRHTTNNLRSLVTEKWPFFALSLGAAVLAIVGQKVAGAIVQSELHGPSARVAQSFHGLAFYVRKTLWPQDLQVFYAMRVPLDPSEPRFILSIVAVIAVAILLYRFRRRAPAAVTACAAYALLVAPVLGLVQTGSQLVADRYSYLSTIPFFLLAVGVWLQPGARFARASTAVLITLTLALVPLVRATDRQIRVWHDTRSLWEHDVAIDPTNFPSRRSLIDAYMDEGRAATNPAQRKALFERALQACNDGLALEPDAATLSRAAKIYDLLAAVDPSQRAHYLDQALDHALRSIAQLERTQQRLPDAYESAGIILAELGRPDDALPHLRKLVALDPKNARRQGTLGEVAMQAGHPDEALAALELARQLDPTSTVIDLDLGDVHRQLGHTDSSVAAYRRVLERKRTQLGAAAGTDPDYMAAMRALVEMGQRP